MTTLLILTGILIVLLVLLGASLLAANYIANNS